MCVCGVGCAKVERECVCVSAKRLQTERVCVGWENGLGRARVKGKVEVKK